MAHSRFVNAFSRISKNYVFRFKIFCFVFVVGVVVVCVKGGGGEAGCIWYFIQLKCTHSKLKFKGNNFHTMRSFVLVIKNNEAVLAIKLPAAPNNKMTCAQISLGIRPVWLVFAVRLTEV